jgi:hypothetical protein
MGMSYDKMQLYMIEMMISDDQMINRYIVPDENSRVGPVVGIADGFDEETTIKTLRNNKNPTTNIATHSFLDGSHSDPVLDRFIV